MYNKPTLEVGDIVDIQPGQQFGRKLSKIVIRAKVVEEYTWSTFGQSSILVECKLGSNQFMVNLFHSKALKVSDEETISK